MQVGDLVKLKDNVVPLIGSSDKLGIVRCNQTAETELFDWDEFEDLSYNRLEVVSASR